jgi:tetratricopeptide (TPR) repeat protein
LASGDVQHGGEEIEYRKLVEATRMQVCDLHKSRQVGRGLSVVFLFFITSAAQACLWDWDTLQMERRRFPGTLEMITGKFVRHSPAYYEWRIQDRTKRFRSPAEDPDLADDLAVAYSKLGRHAEGIALLEKVLAAHPDRYETLANLGTIHMLAGDLQVGKEYVDRAIAVNSDAHFGREKYQSLLAEYFLTTRKSPHPAAESSFVIHPKGHPCGFAAFVLEKRGWGNRWISEESEDIQAIKAELAAAQKGVLGMMHFANYDSPMLLEALGDLLIAWPTYQEDALQLAARSYYRVAQLSEDKKTKDEFERAAANILEGSLDYLDYQEERGTVGPEATLEKLSAELNRELAEAQAYFNSIAADERRWIAEGVDVDKAFASKYYDSLESTIEDAKKQLATERLDVRGDPYQEAVHRGLLILGAIAVALAAVVCGACFTYRRIRSRSDKLNDHTESNLK